MKEEQLNCIIENLKINKICHNDLYAENIGIDKTACIALIDFDLAYCLKDENAPSYETRKQQMYALLATALADS